MDTPKEPEDWAEARRRIAACKARRETSLDLRSLRLTDLPEEIAALTWLEDLDLSVNQIGEEGARHLSALTVLTVAMILPNFVADRERRLLMPSAWLVAGALLYPVSDCIQSATVSRGFRRFRII